MAQWVFVEQQLGEKKKSEFKFKQNFFSPITLFL